MDRVFELKTGLAFTGVLAIIVGVAVIFWGWNSAPLALGGPLMIVGSITLLIATVLFVGWGILTVLLDMYRQWLTRR